MLIATLFIIIKKWKKHKARYTKNAANTVQLWVLVVYPRDCEADWELRLPAAAQRHERVSCSK